MDSPIFKVLESPANWSGLAFCALGPFLAVTEVVVLGGAATIGLAALGYCTGFVLGGKAFGFPDFSSVGSESHEEVAQHNARMKIIASLAAIRYQTETNPEQRLKRVARERIYAICDEINTMLDQWAQSKTTLHFEDTFNAQQIAVKFLPTAINRFRAIPKEYAGTQVLENGKTAQAVFEETLDDLSGKITQLKEKLAQQDAQALVNHASFVSQKYKDPN
jgi:hypothetical protein